MKRSYVYSEEILAFCSLLNSILGNRIIFLTMMVVRLINKARHNIYYNAILFFFMKKDVSFILKRENEYKLSRIHSRPLRFDPKIADYMLDITIRLIGKKIGSHFPS